MDALADLHSLDWEGLGLADYGRPAQLPRASGRSLATPVRGLPAPRPARLRRRGVVARAEPAAGRAAGHPARRLPCRQLPLQPDRPDTARWRSSTGRCRRSAIRSSTSVSCLAFWGDDRLDPPAMPRIQGFSRDAGAPTRAALAERYAQRSGRSVEHLAYYMALAFWKLAAIVEGAHLHFTTGALQTGLRARVGARRPATARRSAGVHRTGRLAMAGDGPAVT